MKRIGLTRGKFAVVDDDLFDVFNAYKWCARFDPSCNKFYAKRNFRLAVGKQTQMEMHHAVIGRPLNGLMVDHINGDGLDNRRENLRIVTNRQNQTNQHRHRNGRLVGALTDKITGKWKSQVVVSGKAIYLGIFDSEQEAHDAYIAACAKFGVK